MFQTTRLLINQASIRQDYLDRLDLAFLGPAPTLAGDEETLRFSSLERKDAALARLAKCISDGEKRPHTFAIKDEGDLRFAQMLCRYVPLTLTVDQGTVTREPMRELAEAIAAFRAGDLWSARRIARNRVETGPRETATFDSAVTLAVILEVGALPFHARAVYATITATSHEERAVLLANHLSLELRSVPSAFVDPEVRRMLSDELSLLVQESWEVLRPKTYILAVGALALHHYRQGDAPSAVTLYRDLRARLGPALNSHWKAVVSSNLGRALLESNDERDVAEGLGELARSCETEPGFPDHFVVLINAYADSGDSVSALRLSATARRLHPDDPSVQTAAAYASALSGGYDEAVDLYLRSFETEPFRPERLTNAADCALRRGNVEHALQLALSVSLFTSDPELCSTAELIRVEAQSHMKFEPDDPALRPWVLGELQVLGRRFPHSAEIQANISALWTEIDR